MNREKKPLWILSIPLMNLKDKRPSEIVMENVDFGFNAQHLNVPIPDPRYKHSREKGEEQPLEYWEKYMDEYLRTASEKGFNTILYFNVHCLKELFLKEHPKWVQRDMRGEPIRGLYGGKKYVTPCVNTGYRTWVAERVKYLLKRYNIAGIFLDGPCFFEGACYCESCREKFREKYGEELPAWEDWENPSWKKFLEFRYESITEFLKDVYQAGKEVREDAIIYKNSSPLAPTWPLGRDNRRLIKFEDMLGAEGGFIFYGRPLDIPLWKASATAKMLETQSEGKPRVIFSAMHFKPWTYYRLPETEILLLIAATVANGAYVWLGGYIPGDYERFPRVRKELRWLRSIEEYLYPTEPYYRVALTWSWRSLDFYGRETLEDIDFKREVGSHKIHERRRSFMEEFNGFYEMLVRLHIPFGVIDDKNLEREDIPSKLILPNVGSMSERTVNTIYESRNKTLILASGETSLFNEWGERRDFSQSLQRKFGYDRISPIVRDRWEHIKIDEKVLERVNLQELIPIPEAPLKVSSTGGKNYAYYMEKMENRYDRIPPVTDHPAISRRGNFIYLAGCFGIRYWNDRIPEYRKLLNYLMNLQENAVLMEPDIGPVEAIIRRRGRDLILHLINYNGEMNRPIEKILERENIKIKLPLIKEPAKIKELRRNSVLKFRRDGNGRIEFTLPRLSHYEIILVEDVF